MKKTNLFLLIAFLTLNAFSQETKYVVFDNPQDGTCKAFEVRTKTIQSHKYELKELDNPEYIAIKAQIDSLEDIENNLSSFPDILDSETKSNLKQAKNFLEQAIEEDKNSEISFLSKKKEYLTSATEFLFKTKFEFEQDVKGRDAIKQAKINVTKIDDLLNLSSRKEREINSKLHSKISSLKREIGIGGHPKTSITEKISKYVPVEAIEREILFVDTTVNVGNELEGSFVAFDNMYGPKYIIMRNDYNEYVKNELVPSKELESLEISKYGGKYERIKDYQDPRYHGGFSYEDTYLFKKSDENKLYFTTDNYLEKCGAVEQEQYEALSFLEDKGGKYYYEDDALWVEINDAKCMFTPIIKEALANKDLTIINKMYKSVNQHKIYKDQASDLAVKMGKFMNKFVSDMITSEDISEWRKITVECNKILEKMGNLPFADKQEYYKQTRNENKTGLQYAEIVDRCNGSKKMLGL